jgi:hypothetical protein
MLGLNKNSKRGDENEPPLPSVSDEILRPLKLIFNVACQANLTVDTGTSCQISGLNTLNESRPTKNNGRLSKGSVVSEKGVQADESLIV